MTLLLLGTVLACDGGLSGASPTSADAEKGADAVPEAAVAGDPDYVGKAACVACHPEQGKRFQGSHHDRAMDHARRDRIAAPFAGETLVEGGRRWKFIQEAEQFWVELVEGRSPARRLRVEYTFGVSPLQQYLVERERGRFQALPAAWDARPKSEGGQRWFSLNEGAEAPVGDALHWDALAYNWNSQCASCHSTALKKNYSEAEDAFKTAYAEIDVACEACHGPGAAHQADPEIALPVSYESFGESRWTREEGQRIASRSAPLRADQELDVCGGCHARRSPLREDLSEGMPLLDAYRPSLMEPGLYFEDGQIQEEVYVWGSFLQSRMHAAGVRCSDCHDPHSLSLRREGNALCGGCHAPEVFDVRAHHGHSEPGEGTECISCHMPERTYMGVDARGDHAFPVPRPRLNAALGAPQICATCHSGKSAAWAAEAIERGKVGGRAAGRLAGVHWSEALVAGEAPRDDPRRWLEIATDARTPEWVRASAWARYAEEAEGAPPLDFLEPRFRAAGSLERLGLIELARRLEAAPRLALLVPLLEDEARAVRVAAAEALTDLPAAQLPPAARSALGRGQREYRIAQEANAERPEAQVNLAGLALAYGETDRARAALERALRVAPYFVPAHVNLADLDRALGRDAAALERLRTSATLAPEDGSVRYALGLALHRTGQKQEALVELEQASQAAPLDPRFRLAYALSLHGAGRSEEAIAGLAEAVRAGAANADVYQAWASLLRDGGELKRARTVANAWLAALPGDARAAAFLQDLAARAPAD
ncbi:MAG: cytochrome c3 family protein [Myxococcota bacterium]